MSEIIFNEHQCRQLKANPNTEKSFYESVESVFGNNILRRLQLGILIVKQPIKIHSGTYI